MATTFRDAEQAFDKAIAEGRLTPETAPDYMYMGTREGRDLFKHIDTREYLA